MINTFYGLGTLDSAAALFTALVIGFFFGLALERAGFGSSRRLAGIFYFKDMAVLKVMFSALITATLGLNILTGLGVIDPASQIYYIPTYYGAYAVAGLIFGIGFVMSGWCPGTSAVGIASGKLDALVFFGGGILGSLFYNELYPLIKPLAVWGQSTQESLGQPGLAFIYTSLGISKAAFIFILTAVALLMFWGAELIEKNNLKIKTPSYLQTSFFRTFSLSLLAIAATIFIFPQSQPNNAIAYSNAPSSETALLSDLDAAADHIAPRELAERLYQQDPSLIVVDIRSPEEFSTFHIRGAQNVQLPGLPEFMGTVSSAKTVVLYSNGMTHPAQARDALFRLGYANVLMLTDGLTGFLEQCLKPPSLRPYALSAQASEQIRSWRGYFFADDDTMTAQTTPPAGPEQNSPGLVDGACLERHLGQKGIKLIDTRDQADYNGGHIPGAIALSVESIRGAVGGLPSMLMPAEILASHLGLAGIFPGDFVVIIYGGDRVRDATLMAMAFERLGHTGYAILDGGYDQWFNQKKKIDTLLPAINRTKYPFTQASGDMSLTGRQLLSHLKDSHAVILDTRPEEYYRGDKSDEARAGHIPGAVNRPYSKDLGSTGLKNIAELVAAYQKLIPDKETTIYVHCRTGHQASQTYFVLKHLLNYPKVYWYDAGWTEWSALADFPVSGKS